MHNSGSAMDVTEDQTHGGREKGVSNTKVIDRGVILLVNRMFPQRLSSCVSDRSYLCYFVSDLRMSPSR